MVLDGKRIRVLMAEQEMNYSDLAKRANIARQTVSAAIEGSRCRNATIGKIARALGVSASELIMEA